jgi:hypothetical protein
MSGTERRDAIRQRLTPEAITAWGRVRAGEDRYFSCLRGTPCDSPDRHCASCADYLAAYRALEAALGLRPWEDADADDELVAALDDALEQEGNR